MLNSRAVSTLTNFILLPILLLLVRAEVSQALPAEVESTECSWRVPVDVVSSPVTLSSLPSTALATNLRGDAAFVLVGDHAYDNKLIIYDSSALRWRDPIQFAPAPLLVGLTRLVIDQDGDITIIWNNRATSDPRIMAVTCRSGTCTTPITLDSGSNLSMSSIGQVSADPRGNVMVAYRKFDQAQARWGLASALYDKANDIWSTPAFLSMVGYESYSALNAITSLAELKFTILAGASSSTPNGSRTDLYAHSFDGTAAGWASPTILTAGAVQYDNGADVALVDPQNGIAVFVGRQPPTDGQSSLRALYASFLMNGVWGSISQITPAQTIATSPSQPNVEINRYGASMATYGSNGTIQFISYRSRNATWSSPTRVDNGYDNSSRHYLFAQHSLDRVVWPYNGNLYENPRVGGQFTGPNSFDQTAAAIYPTAFFTTGGGNNSLLGVFFVPIPGTSPAAYQLKAVRCQ